MERGYVKLWRKTLDSGIVQSPHVCQLFIYLMLNASRKVRTQLVGGSTFELSPGDVIFGRARAAADLNLSEQNVRTALCTLERLKIITTKSTNKCTIVSFVKWGVYQCCDNTASPAVQPVINQQLTSASPQDKNIEEKKDIKNPPTPQGDGTSKKKSKSLSNADIMALPYAEDFEQVWKAYPKHAAKGQAWVTWYKLTAKMADKFPTVDALLLAIKWLKVSDQWEKDGGKYIPNMSSWLNNAGWEDDEAQVPAPDPRNRVWTPEEEARRKELEDEYNGIAKIYRDQGKWKEAYKVEHILEEILEQEGLGLWQ